MQDFLDKCLQQNIVSKEKVADLEQNLIEKGRKDFNYYINSLLLTVVTFVFGATAFVVMTSTYGYDLVLAAINGFIFMLFATLGFVFNRVKVKKRLSYSFIVLAQLFFFFCGVSILSFYLVDSFGVVDYDSVNSRNLGFIIIYIIIFLPSLILGYIEDSKALTMSSMFWLVCITLLTFDTLYNLELLGAWTPVPFITFVISLAILVYTGGLIQSQYLNKYKNVSSGYKWSALISIAFILLIQTNLVGISWFAAAYSIEVVVLSFGFFLVSLVLYSAVILNTNLARVDKENSGIIGSIKSGEFIVFVAPALVFVNLLVNNILLLTTDSTFSEGPGYRANGYLPYYGNSFGYMDNYYVADWSILLTTILLLATSYYAAYKKDQRVAMVVILLLFLASFFSWISLFLA